MGKDSIDIDMPLRTPPTPCRCPVYIGNLRYGFLRNSLTPQSEFDYSNRTELFGRNCPSWPARRKVFWPQRKTEHHESWGRCKTRSRRDVAPCRRSHWVQLLLLAQTDFSGRYALRPNQGP